MLVFYWSWFMLLFYIKVYGEWHLFSSRKGCGNQSSRMVPWCCSYSCRYFIISAPNCLSPVVKLELCSCLLYMLITSFDLTCSMARALVLCIGAICMILALNKTTISAWLDWQLHLSTQSTAGDVCFGSVSYSHISHMNMLTTTTW